MCFQPLGSYSKLFLQKLSGMERKDNVTLLIGICGAYLLCSCGYRPLEESVLEMADENRVQIEKVLEHYREEGSREKYDAALFLAENMPYHAAIHGTQIRQYDSAYLQMSRQPLARRGDYYAHRMQELGTKGLAFDLDIRRVGTRQLISHIDRTFDLWRKTPWAKDYTDDVFYNYLLPYRVCDEQTGNWRQEMLYIYPQLGKEEVRSRRGYRIEVDTTLTDSEVRTVLGASEGKMLWMERDGRFTLVLSTERACRKSLLFRYAAPELNPTVAISVNGGRADTVVLNASNDLHTYIESRCMADIRLRQGENRVTVANCGNPIAMDYVMLRAVEPLAEDKALDMPAECTIRNCHYDKVLTFGEPRRRDASSLVSLTDWEKGNRWQTLQICSRGYGCCTISPMQEHRDSLCLEAEFCNYMEGARGAQFRYTFGAHQLWTLLPTSDGRYRIMGKDSGLFLEAREDGKGNIRLYLTRYAERDAQIWDIKSSRFFVGKQKPLYGSAIREAMKVYDYTQLWKWCACNTVVPPTLATLLRSRTGNCHEEAMYAVSLCRYLGIPATIDFTPHWGNRSQSHEWPVLIKEDGTGMPFYMKAVLGDTTTYFHPYRKPKVFRTRFAVDTAYQRIIGQDHLPEQWMLFPCYQDVTAEYCPVADAYVPVPDTLSRHGVAYICVFDNRRWVPVFWGEILDNGVTFTDMAFGIMYIAAVSEHGGMKTFGDPFYFDVDGRMHTVKLSNDDRQEMTLRRKFPFLGAQDHFNARMARGRFQAANKSDFSDAKDLHTFVGITNGNWYDVEVKDNTPYRYVRYLGPNGSYCNINELQYFDPQGKSLNGKIIGTQGSGGQEKEKVFDGDILTGFNGISPDGHWVGLDFGQPRQIGRMKFIGRNDGNTVEVGDTYEFYCWDGGAWRLLDTRTAEDNVLTYKDMPSHGLYVLRDKTKGWEERIFTYEDDQQVWW